MDWDEFDKWWHKHDNTKEFGQFIRRMSDDQLYEASERSETSEEREVRRRVATAGNAV